MFGRKVSKPQEGAGRVDEILKLALSQAHIIARLVDLLAADRIRIEEYQQASPLIRN